MLTIRGTAETLRQRLEQEQQQLEGTASRLSMSTPSTEAADPIPSTSSLAHGSPMQGESHGENASNGKEQDGTATAASSTTELPSPPRPTKPAKPWALAAYGIPAPDPSILPDATLEAKLRHFHVLRSQGIHFNATLQSNKSFRNPAILSKLVDFVDVDEKLSNFPPEVWRSSHGLGRDAWAESIAERQKALAEERQKLQERGKRSNIDFASSSSSASASTSSLAHPHSSSNMGANGRSGPGADREERKKSRWDSSSKADSARKRDNDAHRDRDRERERDRERDRDRHRDRSRSPSGRRR